MSGPMRQVTRPAFNLLPPESRWALMGILPWHYGALRFLWATARLSFFAWAALSASRAGAWGWAALLWAGVGGSVFLAARLFRTKFSRPYRLREIVRTSRRKKWRGLSVDPLLSVIGAWCAED